MAVEIVKQYGEVLTAHTVVRNIGVGQTASTILQIHKPGTIKYWSTGLSGEMYLSTGEEYEFSDSLNIREAMEPGIYDVKVDVYDMDRGKRELSLDLPGEVEILEPVPPAPAGKFTVAIVGIPPGETHLMFRFWWLGDVHGGAGWPPDGQSPWFPTAVPIHEGFVFQFDLNTILQRMQQHGKVDGIFSGTLHPPHPTGVWWISSSHFRPENRGYTWNLTTGAVE